LLAFSKKWVLEYKVVILLFDFMEIIHIELPNKAGEVAMPKVLGQDFLGESHDVLDDKANSIFLPADHLIELRMLKLILNVPPESSTFLSEMRQPCHTNAPPTELASQS
jgi:hypothetical protein